MARLFGRRSAVTVGTHRMEELRHSFNVTRVHTRDPNTAKVVLTNQSDLRRFSIADGHTPLAIEAGYRSLYGQIFSGTIVDHQTHREGSEWVTEISAEDGGPQIRRARINTNIRQADIEAVFSAVAESFGVGVGNALAKAREGDLRGAIGAFASGVTLSGNTPDVFDQMCRSLGYGWSIQDNELLVLRETETVGPRAAVLRTGEGGSLIGSPRLGKDGRVTAKALLQPALVPGRYFDLRATDITGQFKIETSGFVGDSRGGSWYVDLEGVPI